ncbi:hypothetical protein [Saccharopolyspora phatthalungensis]|uniref:Uncharacterized protein n=1 Tax=Saccharopolyspora phatthalungensis TaxID=664693 RepID=A0A840Q916_9PSEU|nr:hypothetical protein [Saccharopolyspora phatthalungensis]MBB5154935.1 hypothetical protein [Saccharopolyspora phatthalungensis]
MLLTPTNEDVPHIAALQRAVEAGFKFMHLRDGHGELAAIYAERRCGYGVVENITLRGMDEAVAARFRVEDYPHGDPLWREHGTVEEVITAVLELPPHGSPGAPNSTHRRGSGLWVPGEGF